MNQYECGGIWNNNDIMIEYGWILNIEYEWKLMKMDEYGWILIKRMNIFDDGRIKMNNEHGKEVTG